MRPPRGLLRRAGPTTVVEPAPSRDHTERMLAACGARVEREPGVGDRLAAERLRPLVARRSGRLLLRGALLAAATLLPGSELRLHGVGVNPTRTGFLHVLERMGARISVYNRRTAAASPSPTSRSAPPS